MLFIVLLILASTASASELSVEKEVAEKDLEVGGSATVELHFSNPFPSDVAVQIVDRNVLGNNGIDVQCMEFTVRPGESVMQYDPIQLYSDGEFELDAVVVNYTNPETGLVDSVSSETIEVEVEGSSTGGTQGITTIYQCNGMNMQSTSFSSSSMMQQQQQQMSQEQQQQMQDQMQQKKNAVQNNQMDQDAGALKQQMQDQREEYMQQQRDIVDKLQNDSNFREQHEELLSQGYNLTSGEVEPESGDTGKFKMNYQRADGETASLSGSMQNGSLDEFSKRSSEMEKQMMQQMMNNSDYQQMSKELALQGFNQTDVRYDLLGNETSASLQYSKPNGDEANITADFVNATITEVRMEKEERPDYRRTGFLVILIALLLAAGYLLYRKYFGKKGAETGGSTAAEDEKPIDYRKEARKMLEEAKKLFAGGNEKDAYELVGRAVRFYYTHKLGYRKELTNTQTISYLRRHNLAFKDVQKCLNLCGMVEFAKYKANRKDFDSISETAAGVIK